MADTSSSTYSFLDAIERSTIHAYSPGALTAIKDGLCAYLGVVTSTSQSSKHAYLYDSRDVISLRHSAYCFGAEGSLSSKSAYLVPGTSTTSVQQAYAKISSDKKSRKRAYAEAT